MAISDLVLDGIARAKFEEALEDPNADPRFRRHQELGKQLGILDENGEQLVDTISWGAVGEDPLRDDKHEFIRLSYWVSSEMSRWMTEIVMQEHTLPKVTTDVERSQV